jgi:dTDP-glucose 4,6-dehydratase
MLFLSSNIVGTFHLVDVTTAYWHRKGQPNDFRFYYCSTDEVYGSLGAEGSFHEMLPLHPNNPYSATKAAGEHFITAWANTFGLPFLISRCSNNYGPYQGTDKFVPLTIYRCLSGQPVLIHGDGSNIRDWLYVKDHVKAIIAVMKHGIPGEIYNIGAGLKSEFSNLAMAEMICDMVDEILGRSQGTSKLLITFVQDRPGNDQRYSMNSAKLYECSSWQPKTQLNDGLRTTVEWYVKNRKADLNQGDCDVVH